MESAIRREKAIKKWNREWKLRLIEESNGEWRDLWLDIVGGEREVPDQQDQNGLTSRPAVEERLRLRGNDENFKFLAAIPNVASLSAHARPYSRLFS